MLIILQVLKKSPNGNYNVLDFFREFNVAGIHSCNTAKNKVFMICCNLTEFFLTVVHKSKKESNVIVIAINLNFLILVIVSSSQ